MRASKYGRSIPNHVPTATEERAAAKRNAPPSWSLTIGTCTKWASIAIACAYVIGKVIA